jgi:hypothetical protein
MLRQLSQIPVQLLIPVRNPRRFRQVLDLIDIATSQAATIAFLQGNDIVVA